MGVELSEECIDGTIELNLNKTVQEALKPFYLDFADIIKDPKDVSECDVDIKWQQINASCSFDFSNMIEEHAEAKRACGGAGGKIFLFDLDFAESGTKFGWKFDLSLNITQFPLCVDEDCAI